MIRKLILPLLLGAAFLFGSTNTSHAAFGLKLTEGSTTVSVTDNGAGDLDPTVGVITFSGAVGTFTTNVSTGITFPTVGNATHGRLDLNSVDVSSTSGGTLTIEAFAEYPLSGDASNPGPAFVAPTGQDLGAEVSVGGTTDGTVTTTFTIREEPADADHSVTLGPLSGSNSPFVGNFFGAGGIIPNGATGTYSLKIVSVIQHSPSSTSSITSFDADLQVVPGPGGLPLVLAAIPFLGGAYWRKRRTKKREQAG